MIALDGTFSIPLKLLLASNLVVWSNVISLVVELKWDPGSLKPI